MWKVGGSVVVEKEGTTAPSFPDSARATHTQNRTIFFPKVPSRFTIDCQVYRTTIDQSLHRFLVSISIRVPGTAIVDDNAIHRQSPLYSVARGVLAPTVTLTPVRLLQILNRCMPRTLTFPIFDPIVAVDPVSAVFCTILNRRPPSHNVSRH